MGQRLPKPKNTDFALASLLECPPMHRKVTGLIPGQRTYPGFRFVPSACMRKATINASLSHQFPSLSLSIDIYTLLSLK